MPEIPLMDYIGNPLLTCLFLGPALASVAIPITTATFQCPTPARTEFCALDSWFRDCSSRDVAHSDRDRDLGARATRRIIELVCTCRHGPS